MKPTIYYCYDAWCGWCYGFSKTMQRIAETFEPDIFFDVLSGGMIPEADKQPISVTAPYIRDNYQRVEELAGVSFGHYYLWHINHPDQSDWFPESSTPAIALCILKEMDESRAVSFAAAIQNALFAEGRDLSDPEAYRPMLQQFGFPEKDFFEKLASPEYREKAQYEFALVKQLQVNGFPCVLMQVSESKFYLLAKGYTPYEDLAGRIKNVLTELKNNVS